MDKHSLQYLRIFLQQWSSNCEVASDEELVEAGALDAFRKQIDQLAELLWIAENADSAYYRGYSAGSTDGWRECCESMERDSD